jgi:acyl-CoA synthetase (AMP-forming)/AMP-acid ligase II
LPPATSKTQDLLSALEAAGFRETRPAVVSMLGVILYLTREATRPTTAELVPAGVIGELCTRGYHVMLGYFEDPRATAEAIDADGWLHTGDLCSMDERGFCAIEGRLKNMIIRGGENIYPREIEQLLFSHPSVADVVVVGVPDRTWGEQVAAFVRPAAGHAPTWRGVVRFLPTAPFAAHSPALLGVRRAISDDSLG